MRLENFVADNVGFGKVDFKITLDGLKDALKCAESLSKLVGNEIDLEVKKHHEKRSMNANNYFYQLIGKLAEATDSSKDEVHNLMLGRYGQYMKDKDDNIVFCLYPADIDYRNLTEVHLKPTGHTENRNSNTYEWFAVMRGSHTYDSKEMAKLIDGVVDECKELGIQTMSDEEINRMVKNYGR